LNRSVIQRIRRSGAAKRCSLLRGLRRHARAAAETARRIVVARCLAALILSALILSALILPARILAIGIARRKFGIRVLSDCCRKMQRERENCDQRARLFDSPMLHD
jgi:hypothetical protein